jgi:hypothetical protein
MGGQSVQEKSFENRTIYDVKLDKTKQGKSSDPETVVYTFSIISFPGGETNSFYSSTGHSKQQFWLEDESMLSLQVASWNKQFSR